MAGKKRKKQRKAEKPGLRMNELMAATRLPRSTLAHWIKEGLLPKPVRTSRTMAYYQPVCVELAEKIAKMQAQDMPLNRIKGMLKMKEKGIDIDSFIDLHRLIFGVKKGPTCNLTEFCDATGLTSKQAKELVEKKLLFPIRKNRFDTEDISVGLLYAWGFKEGIQLEDLENQFGEAERMVNIGIDLSLKLTGDMPYEKAMEVKKQLWSSLSNIQYYLRSRIFKKRMSVKNQMQRSFPDERLWKENGGPTEKKRTNQ